MVLKCAFFIRKNGMKVIHVMSLSSKDLDLKIKTSAFVLFADLKFRKMEAATT